MTEYLALLGLLTGATILAVFSFGDALEGSWGRAAAFYDSLTPAATAAGEEVGITSESGGDQPAPGEETAQNGGGKNRTDLPCAKGIEKSGGAAGGSNCGGKN